jgi:hypothetical protein
MIYTILDRGTQPKSSVTTQDRAAILDNRLGAIDVCKQEPSAGDNHMDRTSD